MNDLTTLRAFLEARNADEKQWDAIDRIEVAIKDAAKAFEFISSNWTTRNLKPSETIRQVFYDEKIAEAKEALAKLQPFLKP